MKVAEKFIVLDTETANKVEQPLPYDIGWAIVDRNGNIYAQRSYIVKEVFCGMRDVMASAYYAEKIPNYEEDIKNGSRLVKGFWEIRRHLLKDMKEYHIKKVGAYNMNFDKRALNNDIRYISKSWMRWFFPYGTEFFCIWNWACQVLLNRKSYIDFALKNNLITPNGNISTSAENCYKYITQNPTFIESHTGLEDVLIETEIMIACFKQHKKIDKKISPCPWRKVQKKRKDMALSF